MALFRQISDSSPGLFLMPCTFPLHLFLREDTDGPGIKGLKIFSALKGARSQWGIPEPFLDTLTRRALMKHNHWFSWKDYHRHVRSIPAHRCCVWVTGYARCWSSRLRSVRCRIGARVGKAGIRSVIFRWTYPRTDTAFCM